MKTRFVAVTVILVIGVVWIMSACGGSIPTSPTGSTTNPGGSTSGNSFSATIDGTPWTALYIHPSFASGAVAKIPSYLVIDAYDTNLGLNYSKWIELQVWATATGTFTTTTTACPYCPFFALTLDRFMWTAATGSKGTSGSITLTTFTERAAVGTFSFTGIEQFGGTAKTTSGQFSVVY